MSTLQNYVTEVQRLLHDATAQYWSIAEIIDYVNDARNRTVGDTGCNRVLQPSTFVAGQEAYLYSSFPNGANTIDVLNVTILWGQARIVLGQMSFSEFNPKFRTYQNLQSRPVCFAKYGQGALYIGPMPDQTYSVELDTVCIPDPLVNLTDMETALIWPYSSPVAFYAAYKAKYKEQSYIEAQTFHDEYIRKCKDAIVQTLTRSIPSLYSSL